MVGSMVGSSRVYGRAYVGLWGYGAYGGLGGSGGLMVGSGGAMGPLVGCDR